MSGEARGADRLGERYAAERHPADWGRHGRGAGYVRNRRLIEAADVAVFFWDGASRGTADAIGRAKARGIPVEIVVYPAGGPG